MAPTVTQEGTRGMDLGGTQDNKDGKDKKKENRKMIGQPNGLGDGDLTMNHSVPGQAVRMMSYLLHCSHNPYEST